MGVVENPSGNRLSGATIRSALRGAKVKFKGVELVRLPNECRRSPHSLHVYVTETNKYFISWWAVLSPCHKARGSPRHPALTASQFCGHATGVDPHREDAGPIFLVPGGRLHRSIGLRDTAHQRQPRQFPFG